MDDLYNERVELHKRVQTLWFPAKNDYQRQEQLMVLHGLIQRICNELFAIKSVLRDKGILDDEFNKVVADKMVDDHGGPGADPFEYTAWYPYLYPEQLYLKEVLKLSDAEIADFNEDADGRAKLT